MARIAVMLWPECGTFVALRRWHCRACEAASPAKDCACPCDGCAGALVTANANDHILGVYVCTRHQREPVAA